MDTLQKILHPKSLFEGERVVVVTGGDKGIGYAVVKGILKENPSWVVYLTSRDEARGNAAVKRLHEENSLTARYHLLDIDNLASIQRFRDHVKEQHKNGIHILINNAGIFPILRDFPVMPPGEVEKEDYPSCFDKENFRLIIKNNYFSTLQVCQELFPLLGENSTVVFVGSRMANLAYMATLEDKQLKLHNCTRIDDISKLMEQLMGAEVGDLYNAEEKGDNAEEKGDNAWLAKSPDTELIANYRLGEIYPWAMAKLGVAILCRLYQVQVDAEKQPQNIHLVTCCPGLVKTDSNPRGTRTTEEGADTIIWAATQPKESPIRGVLCGDRKMIDAFVLPEGSEIFWSIHLQATW